MIQRQFVSIFTMSDTEFGREQRHLKRPKFVFRRAIGSFHVFHHTGSMQSVVPNGLLQLGHEYSDVVCFRLGLYYRGFFDVLFTVTSGACT